MSDNELREQLAAIEHERWAGWQKWMHGLMYLDGNDAVLERSWYDRWEEQIATPYDKLSDTEKASDMEQVDRYWSLLEEWKKS